MINNLEKNILKAICELTLPDKGKRGVTSNDIMKYLNKSTAKRIDGSIKYQIRSVQKALKNLMDDPEVSNNLTYDKQRYCYSTKANDYEIGSELFLERMIKDIDKNPELLERMSDVYTAWKAHLICIYERSNTFDDEKKGYCFIKDVKFNSSNMGFDVEYITFNKAGRAMKRSCGINDFEKFEVKKIRDQNEARITIYDMICSNLEKYDVVDWPYYCSFKFKVDKDNDLIALAKDKLEQHFGKGTHRIIKRKNEEIEEISYVLSEYALRRFMMNPNSLFNILENNNLLDFEYFKMKLSDESTKLYNGLDSEMKSKAARVGYEKNFYDISLTFVQIFNLNIILSHFLGYYYELDLKDPKLNIKKYSDGNVQKGFDRTYWFNK